MRKNSCLKSEMIPEMQIPGALPRSEFWLHVLAAFQLQARQGLSMSSTIQCGFQDQKKTSGILTQQRCEENGCSQPCGTRRKATAAAPGIFCKSKFALLLLRLWAILAHVSVWTTIYCFWLLQLYAWSMHGTFSFFLTPMWFSQWCRIIDGSERVFCKLCSWCAWPSKIKILEKFKSLKKIRT